MFKYMCLFACVCAVAQARNIAPAPALKAPQLGALAWQVQPALTVQYLVPVSKGHGHGQGHGHGPSNNLIAAPINNYAPALISNHNAGPISNHNAGPAHGPILPVDAEALSLARLALSLPSPPATIIDEVYNPQRLAPVLSSAPLILSSNGHGAPIELAHGASAAGAASNLAGHQSQAPVRSASYKH